MSTADVQEIRIRRLYLHETLTSIAERFDVAHSYIHQVAIGAARADVPESEEEAAERKRHEALHEACQAAIKGLQDGTIPFDNARYTESPEERRKRIQETMGVEEVKPR